MPIRSDIDVEKLDLSIPCSAFPLKSDTVLGYHYPFILYQTDECSFDELRGTRQGDKIVFRAENLHGCDTGSCWLNAVMNLCLDHKGTLIAKETGEEGDVDYVRIRDGVKKKVKIVEEE